MAVLNMLSSVLLFAAAPMLISAQDSGELFVSQEVANQLLLRGASRDLQTDDPNYGRNVGFATFFHGFGIPFGGCGLPEYLSKDDNGRELPYVALNVNSEWKDGSNCGRWIEIMLGPNCRNAINTQWEICKGGNLVDDEHTGKIIYGYVLDSCGDMNAWCQSDFYHLDLSAKYVEQQNLMNDGALSARQLKWKYISYTPEPFAMNDLKFLIYEGSRDIHYDFWISLTIYNTRNGIGKVEQLMKDGWQRVEQLTNLGLVYNMKDPAPSQPEVYTDALYVRVHGKDEWGGPDGALYGTYRVEFSCGPHTVCHPSRMANSQRRDDITSPEQVHHF